MSSPSVRAFFHEPTFTVSYLLWDPATRRAAVIDSVLDFDPKSGRTGTCSAEAILAAAREEKLTIDWLLETHAHADHISGNRDLAALTKAAVLLHRSSRAVYDHETLDHLRDEGLVETFGSRRRRARPDADASWRRLKVLMKRW